MIFSCSIKLSRHRQAPWLSQATCTHSFYRQAFSPASSQQVVTPLLYRQLGQSRLLKDSSVIAPSSPQVSEWLGVQTSLQHSGRRWWTAIQTASQGSVARWTDRVKTPYYYWYWPRGGAPSTHSPLKEHWVLGFFIYYPGQNINEKNAFPETYCPYYILFIK